jgi:guanylate kinase
MSTPENVSAGVRRRGLMLVLSSPSGAGKTTISRRLLAEDDNLGMSVSVTTRPMRPGEVADVDYRFVDRRAFDGMVARGELIEHAHVFGHDYGTPRAPVEAALAEGRDMLFDIDWQGAQQLSEAMGEDVVKVFILPPSTPELARRLKERAQDPPQVVRDRMARAAGEMTHWPEYDYVVVNRNIDRAVAEVSAILCAERLRRERYLDLHKFVSELTAG